MSKGVAGLLLLAVGLLALSFVEWGGRGAPVVAEVALVPTAPSPTVAPPTATTSPAALGRTLFQIKGCASCHRHDGLNVARVSVADNDRFFASVIGAPDLTAYEPDPAFVRDWLRDPAAVRPETNMPDLNLTDEEIEALLAFLQE